MERKKLRLLLTQACNRKCPRCCNNDWDLNSLEKETDYSQYDLIMLTGGEPMLFPDLIEKVVKEIRETSTAKIYVYTAKVDNVTEVIRVLNLVDGLTVTLHEQKDVAHFKDLYYLLEVLECFHKKSLRLNIFKEVYFPLNVLPLWKVKDNIEWIRHCPLPTGEVFMKY